ncbi:outer membrane beta-barrel protein [Parapedobacter sp. GCM10030251]|uniref:outer membrane beta-barrel protein n=1 Tax=Parapedobacter sp. GCM10030251 TaxID=3273419 RepID=UPI00361392D1
MKYISLTVLFCATCFLAPAQEKNRLDSLRKNRRTAIDTVIMEDVNTGEKRKVRILIPGKDEGVITIEKSEKTYEYAPDDEPCGKASHTEDDTESTRKSRPIYGVTFSRIDLGLVKLIDNGSFTLSDDNRDFRYRPGKTVNFGFDLLQAGYRFNDNFRIFLSGGFDWTYIRLRENIDFQENTTPLTWAYSDVDYDKNRLTSTYLRLPLTFEFRSRSYSGLGRLRFAFGPEGGFLLKGTQRFKSEELGKQKFKDDYNFTQFRYGAFARFGVGPFGIYGKYYFNDLFENSPNQAGLQNFTFGLMLGF